MPTPERLRRSRKRFAHIIEKFTEDVGLSRYTLYVQDYGAPIGFRLATTHPQRVQALIIQNGNDNWLIDQPLLDRPGKGIQLQRFYGYRSNLPALSRTCPRRRCW